MSALWFIEFIKLIFEKLTESESFKSIFKKSLFPKKFPTAFLQQIVAPESWHFEHFLFVTFTKCLRDGPQTKRPNILIGL